jgi:ribosome-associated protein
MDAKTFSEQIIKVLQDKKAEDIVRVNLTGKTEVSDFFVVASGRSMTHTRSLIENVEYEMEKIGVRAIRSEGVREGRWAVLDYGDVIVHIFNDESRLFYHLEKLWDDGENVEKF